MRTSEDSTDDFTKLLHFLRDHRGFDFTGYKPNTLARRVRKRMDEVGVADHAGYVEHLELHPDEFARLFNTILINVTSLFRDPAPWEHLQSVVIPELLANREPNEPLRIWSAGCASGEEAYGLAIVMCEVLGENEFVERVKIYGTDVDDEALLDARAGVFGQKAVEHLDPGLVSRYFESIGSQHRFRSDLRRNLIFGRHDITTDPPISNLDLLVCRNTLMYLNSETQGRVLPRFHYALRPDGALFLGRAEMLLTRPDLFRPVEIRHRLFRRVENGTAETPRRPSISRASLPEDAELQDLAFHAGQSAEIVVDTDSVLVAANARARESFAIEDDDVGRLLRDLKVSYKPVELRGRIEQVLSEKRAVQVRNVERTFPEGDPQFFDVVLTPLGDAETPRGVSIVFADVTRFTLLQLDVKRSNEQLERAYEQLQSTNEELETTNEELQSMIEERETTNEELQSTNEELETTNEELQSTNEELETMTVELRVRSEDAVFASGFLEGLVDTLADPVIALNDRDEVVFWSAAAVEVWGLTSEEVHLRPLSALEFGLHPGDVLTTMQAVRDHGDRTASVTVAAMTRRGRSFSATVTVRRLSTDQFDDGLVLVTTGHDTEEATATIGS